MRCPANALPRVLYQLLALTVGFPVACAGEPELPRASSLAGSSETDTTVVAAGVGLDKAEATKEALRNAVRQVVGVYVDSKTIVVNDEIITDKVIMLSDAFVKKIEVIPESVRVRTNGLVELRLNATVSRDKVLTSLRHNDVKTSSNTIEIDPESDLGRSFTIEERKAALEELFFKEFETFPEQTLLATPGRPAIVSVKDGMAVIDIPITIKPDLKKYEIVAQRLTDMLIAHGCPHIGMDFTAQPYRDSQRLKKLALKLFYPPFRNELEKTFDDKLESNDVVVSLVQINSGSSWQDWADKRKPADDFDHFHESPKVKELISHNDSKARYRFLSIVTKVSTDGLGGKVMKFLIESKDYNRWFPRRVTGHDVLCTTAFVDKSGQEVHPADTVCLASLAISGENNRATSMSPLTSVPGDWAAGLGFRSYLSAEVQFTRRIAIPEPEYARVKSLTCTLKRPTIAIFKHQYGILELHPDGTVSTPESKKEASWKDRGPEIVFEWVDKAPLRPTQFTRSSKRSSEESSETLVLDLTIAGKNEDSEDNLRYINSK